MGCIACEMIERKKKEKNLVWFMPIDHTCNQLIYKKPDFEKMKKDNPSLYAKYELAKKICEPLAINNDGLDVSIQKQE